MNFLNLNMVLKMIVVYTGNTNENYLQYKTSLRFSKIKLQVLATILQTS
jgi:hypothetical protein